ncbi:MAG: hypothetical protein QXY15_10605, partial [Candidatus Nitrosotenuis sp.]
HAVGSDNLEELTECVNPNSALVLVEFAGRVYIAKDEGGKTLIIGEKARPALIIVSEHNSLEAIKANYNAPIIMPFQVEDVGTVQLKTGHIMKCRNMTIVDYKDPDWLNKIIPSIEIPNVNILYELTKPKARHTVDITIYDDNKLVAVINNNAIEVMDDSYLAAQSVGEALLFSSAIYNHRFSSYTISNSNIIPISADDVNNINNPILITAQSCIFILNSDLSYFSGLSYENSGSYPRLWIEPSQKDYQILETFADKVSANSIVGWAPYNFDNFGRIYIPYTKVFWDQDGNVDFSVPNEQYANILSKIWSSFYSVNPPITTSIPNNYHETRVLAVVAASTNIADNDHFNPNQILCAIAPTLYAWEIEQFNNIPVIKLEQLVDLDSISIPLDGSYVLINNTEDLSVNYKDSSLLTDVVDVLLPPAESVARYFYSHLGIKNYPYSLDYLIYDSIVPTRGFLASLGVLKIGSTYRLEITISNTHEYVHDIKAKNSIKWAAIYILYANQQKFGNIVAYEVTYNGIQPLNISNPDDLIYIPNPIILEYDYGMFLINKYDMYGMVWYKNKRVRKIYKYGFGAFTDKVRNIMQNFAREKGLTIDDKLFPLY